MQNVITVTGQLRLIRQICRMPERLQLLADRKPMCSRKLRCPRLEISTWQRIPTRQSRGRKEKTVAEKIAGQETTSGQARSNEIAVVANTTSTEDLKKMEEDGFSISDADSHTIITVTDKIKAALAKAGVDVSSMGGTLTKEQLEEITGSPVVTQQIMDSLAANDLPATEENVQDSAEALAQAASIPETRNRR